MAHVVQYSPPPLEGLKKTAAGKGSIIARWLGTVALALWLGGLVGIGALVAPVTAHFLAVHSNLDPAIKGQQVTAVVGSPFSTAMTKLPSKKSIINPSKLAISAPTKRQSLTTTVYSPPNLDPAIKSQLLTAIVGGSLRVFNPLCDVCGVLLLLSQLALWKYAPRRVAVSGLVVTAMLLASALYLGFGLFPRMDAAQTAGQMNLFDALHKRYEAFSTQLQLPLLLALAALFAVRDTPRHASANS